MNEKKKKVVDTNLGILLICLFSSIFTLVDFFVIDRVLNKYFDYSKCECEKCNSSNLKLDGVVDNKKDDDNNYANVDYSNKLIWKNHFSINCSKIEDDSCYINNDSYEVVLSDNNGIEQISIGSNTYKLLNNQSFGSVFILSDGYIFVSIYGSGSVGYNAFILDPSAQLVNNFTEYFDNKYEYNGVSYHDGYIDIYSTVGIHSSSVCYYGLNYGNDDIVEKIIRYEYAGNGKIKNPITKEEKSFSNYLKEQSGYTNCNDFLKAHPFEG